MVSFNWLERRLSLPHRIYLPIVTEICKAGEGNLAEITVEQQEQNEGQVRRCLQDHN